MAYVPAPGTIASRALAAIAKHGTPISSTDLARAIGEQPQAVFSGLAAAMAHGLVQRLGGHRGRGHKTFWSIPQRFEGVDINAVHHHPV